MAHELTMPKLSDSMADAVILRWLKSPGEAFERGEGLIEVETDKATVVYEAESAGTLGSILVPEGGTAAVGQAIATLGNGEGPAPTERPPAPVQQESTSAQPCRWRPRPTPATEPARGVRTRRRSHGGPRSSSACRCTTWRAPGPAGGSRPRT